MHVYYRHMQFYHRHTSASPMVQAAWEGERRAVSAARARERESWARAKAQWEQERAAWVREQEVWEQERAAFAAGKVLLAIYPSIDG